MGPPGAGPAGEGGGIEQLVELLAQLPSDILSQIFQMVMMQKQKGGEGPMPGGPPMGGPPVGGAPPPPMGGGMP